MVISDRPNPTTRSLEIMSQKVLLNGIDGAQLVEMDFAKYTPLVDIVVKQAETEYVIEPPVVVFSKECRFPHHCRVDRVLPSR